jgi:hypothetical protein
MYMAHEPIEENTSEELTEGEPEESTTANEDDEDSYPPYFMDVF